MDLVLVVYFQIHLQAVEQKTKLVPISLSFPDNKLVFCEGLNATQKPLQQREATHTFYLIEAALAGVVIWHDIDNYSLGIILTE